MSRLDDAFGRFADAAMPGMKDIGWSDQWKAKLAELNDSATYPRVACDIPNCVICEMGRA